MPYDAPLDVPKITDDFARLALSLARKYRFDYSDCLFSAYDSLARSVRDYDASRGSWEVFYSLYANYAIKKHCNEFRSIVRISPNSKGIKHARPRAPMSGEETDEVFAKLFTPDADAPEFSAEQRNALHVALASLKPKDREILELIYLKGLNGVEAGKRMKLTRGGASFRLVKARERLKMRCAEILATRNL